MPSDRQWLKTAAVAYLGVASVVVAWAWCIDLAGSTGPHSFFKFNLPAGSHTFTSQGDESKLTITTEAGKLYFIWQEVKMGMLSGGSKLQLVSESQGKSNVSECTQIQSSY